jgi:hypothetical protein
LVAEVMRRLDEHPAGVASAGPPRCSGPGTYSETC